MSSHSFSFGALIKGLLQGLSDFWRPTWLHIVHLLVCNCCLRMNNAGRSPGRLKCQMQDAHTDMHNIVLTLHSLHLHPPECPWQGPVWRHSYYLLYHRKKSPGRIVESCIKWFLESSVQRMSHGLILSFEPYTLNFGVGGEGGCIWLMRPIPITRFQFTLKLQKSKFSVAEWFGVRGVYTVMKNHIFIFQLKHNI